MKFICPSCGKTNAVPDVWSGNCFVCRKCETQVTTPEVRDPRAHSWLASPGWLAVAIVETLALVGAVVLAAFLFAAAPPAGLPFVEGPSGGEPQLALPGGSLLIDFDAGIASVSAYYRIVRQDVQLLVDDGRQFLLAVHGRPNPWPSELIDSTTAPESAPAVPSLELDLPADADLAGHGATVRMTLRIECPVQQEPGAPVALVQHAPTRELRLAIATPQQAAALASAVGVRHAAFAGAIACAVVAVGLAVVSLALAEKRLTVICPECGRATEATYCHERGALRVTRCPHKRG